MRKSGISLKDIGLKKEGLYRSIVFALGFAIPFIVINLYGNGIAKNYENIRALNPGIVLVYKSIYYFAFIGFVEEVIFRGLFLELISKSNFGKIAGLFLGATIFGIIHVPFYILGNLAFGTIIIKTIIPMIMHLFFVFLRKLGKGNIIGNCICHGLIDLAGNII
jgi:membrane protease YdiL (CAAX protease family)